MPTATPTTVAEWMIAQLAERRELYQEDAVAEIENKFGTRFTYENDNGNLAISRDVLAAFRKLSGNRVVWIRGERYWRFRERSDDKSRQQDY